MILFDVHTHVNFRAFQKDADEVVRRALDAETWLVNVGSQFETSRQAVEMAERYSDGVYAVVGLHPVHVFPHRVDDDEANFSAGGEEFDAKSYRELAERSVKVVGIGECGLEYYDLPDVSAAEMKKKEREVFLQHIDLALELDKALVVHSRDTYDDVYEVLAAARPRPPRILIHSFIGGRREAEKFMELGCYFSLNGIITYKPSREQKPGRSAPDLHEAIRLMPFDRIVLETDAPYLAPAPVRGSRNEPLFVKHVAEKLAELKGLDVENVAAATTSNARDLFKIF